MARSAGTAVLFGIAQEVAARQCLVVEENSAGVASNGDFAAALRLLTRLGGG